MVYEAKAKHRSTAACNNDPKINVPTVRPLLTPPVRVVKFGTVFVDTFERSHLLLIALPFEVWNYHPKV